MFQPLLLFIDINITFRDFLIRVEKPRLCHLIVPGKYNILPVFPDHKRQAIVNHFPDIRNTPIFSGDVPHQLRLVCDFLWFTAYTCSNSGNGIILAIVNI